MSADRKGFLSFGSVFLACGAAAVLTNAIRQHLESLYDYGGGGRKPPGKKTLADSVSYAVWLAVYPRFDPGHRRALGWDGANDLQLRPAVDDAVFRATEVEAKPWPG